MAEDGKFSIRPIFIPSMRERERERERERFEEPIFALCRSSSSVTFKETAACVHSPTSSFDTSASPVGFGPDVRFALQPLPSSPPQVRNSSIYLYKPTLYSLLQKYISHPISVIIVHPVIYNKYAASLNDLSKVAVKLTLFGQFNPKIKCFLVNLIISISPYPIFPVCLSKNSYT